VLA
ncbi:putative thiol peroxidase, partial [Haemophilus influenzae]|jgi:putative transposase